MEGETETASEVIAAELLPVGSGSASGRMGSPEIAVESAGMGDGFLGTAASTRSARCALLSVASLVRCDLSGPMTSRRSRVR